MNMYHAAKDPDSERKFSLKKLYKIKGSGTVLRPYRTPKSFGFAYRLYLNIHVSIS